MRKMETYGEPGGADKVKDTGGEYHGNDACHLFLCKTADEQTCYDGGGDEAQEISACGTCQFGDAALEA